MSYTCGWTSTHRQPCTFCVVICMQLTPAGYDSICGSIAYAAVSLVGRGCQHQYDYFIAYFTQIFGHHGHEWQTPMRMRMIWLPGQSKQRKIKVLWFTSPAVDCSDLTFMMFIRVTGCTVSELVGLNHICSRSIDLHSSKMRLQASGILNHSRFYPIEIYHDLLTSTPQRSAREPTLRNPVRRAAVGRCRFERLSWTPGERRDPRCVGLRRAAGASGVVNSPRKRGVWNGPIDANKPIYEYIYI